MAPDFERLARTPWPIASLASSGIRLFELGLGLFVLEMGRPGPAKTRGEFRPGIRGAHVDDPDRLDPRLWRLDAEQARGLAALDAAPELPLGGHDAGAGRADRHGS